MGVFYQNSPLVRQQLLILHGKLFRLGKVTLRELRKQIYRSLLCGSPKPFFSG